MFKTDLLWMKGLPRILLWVKKDENDLHKVTALHVHVGHILGQLHVQITSTS